MNFLYACLCQGFANWCMLLAFCLPLRHRPHLPLRLAGAGAVLGISSVLVSRVASPAAPGWPVRTLVLFVLAALVLSVLARQCVYLSWPDALYCAIWCVLSSQFLHELAWAGLSFALRSGRLSPPLSLLRITLWQAGLAAAGALLLHFTLGRTIPYSDGSYRIGPRQLASASLMGAAFMLQAAILDGAAAGPLPKSLVLTILLCQFYFLTLIYLQTELFKKSAMEKEMDALNLLYERQRQQYQVARQNVQIINRRCHELKVRIAELRRLGPEAASPQSLDEADRAARLYDAGANTGNEVLDVVLTEKTLLCESREIQLNAVADGSHLDRFEPGDLYALFANLLDNAIESAICTQQPHRRMIDVLVCLRQNFIVVRITSPARPPRSSPSRTEAVELRVVRRIVQKYQGTLTTDTENGFFAVKIIFPLTQEG